jgi:zinc-dependent metalloproteinase lipoprotein
MDLLCILPVIIQLLMKKLLLLCIGIVPLISFSQDLEIRKKRHCATYEVLQNFRKLHPEAETDQQFENWLSKKKAARTFTTLSSTTLPVIFHIVHNGETEGSGTNISQTAIQRQMMQLNKDYANGSNSTYAVAADANIQFALAQTDPLGNPLAQPGIDRVNRNTLGFTAPPYTTGYSNPSDNYLAGTIKPATIWDPNKYINIWILPLESSILGIATFPGGSGLPGTPSSEGATTSGIAVVPTSVGSMFTAGSCSSFMGRTLTHEMGHFLGLRHIWGDAACGTDYCNDTPTHEDSNFGSPLHPKANNCGTTDEMFENYMDYTDDAVTNTFTADQVSRMQTVLANSPYRNTLASSMVGLVSVTSNRIAFAGCSSTASVSETGTSGTNPRYRDVNFYVNVEDRANGNATLTMNAAGTAVANFHYQLLTPTLNFVGGEFTKTVTLRIFDNAEVDGSRTVILSYSISGTGVQAGTSRQSLTVTISDDDNITISENPVTVLSQNFEGSLTGWGTLSTSSFPNQFRFGTVGNAGGSGNCAFVSDNVSSSSYNNSVAGVAVLRSPLITATGLTNLQLRLKYRVWGEEDADGIYDYGILTYSTPSSPTSFNDIPATGAGPYSGVSSVVSGNPTINLPDAVFSNNQFYLGFYWENDSYLGNNPALAVDDIELTADGVRIESSVAASYGYSIRSGATPSVFRSSSNKVIAGITNASTDVSGITVSVTESGSGQGTITTSNGSFFRTQKVIQISPAVPNSTTTYQATLYFTAAELATWGVNKLNLKILKINDGVSLSSPVNSSNSTLVTPVSVTEDVAKGYIAYTGNFTGFSQFVLVSPSFTLPVTLVQFEARPLKKTIELHWRTASENFNKGFVIERSLNGIDFSQIGWADGKGSVSVESNYSFVDNFVQPGQLYHYRLKQLDWDGHQSLSPVRQAILDEAAVALSLYPNPSRDRVNLFLFGITGVADISVMDMKGRRLLYRAGVDLSSMPYSLPTGNLPRGQYTVVIHLKNRDITAKLLRQ